MPLTLRNVQFAARQRRESDFMATPVSCHKTLSIRARRTDIVAKRRADNGRAE